VTSSPALTLRLAAGTRMRRLDGELLVLNPWSWETHLLNEGGVFIVGQLTQGPKSVEQIQQAYRLAHASAREEMCDGEVESFLSELIELGLVSEVPGTEADAGR
jgi:hypothetical protein